MYVGFSEDPWSRLIQHNSKEEGTYSSKHKPWELKAVFLAESKSEALGIERFIKRQKSRKLIERLINPEFALEGRFAKLVRVQHLRD
jgi:putative endonuclease